MSMPLHVVGKHQKEVLGYNAETVVCENTFILRLSEEFCRHKTEFLIVEIGSESEWTVN